MKETIKRIGRYVLRKNDLGTHYVEIPDMIFVSPNNKRQKLFISFGSDGVEITAWVRDSDTVKISVAEETKVKTERF